MDDLKASVDKVTSEHRELREMIQAIRDSLQSPEPLVAERQVRTWAESLAQRLLTLHDRLFLHFREEKEAGVLDELVGRFPRAQRTISALEEEHDELLGEMRKLVAVAFSHAENKPTEGPDLASRTVTLLDKLTSHEERETELIERLYCEDLGTGD